MTMTESILKSLMRLFAIAAQVHTAGDIDKVRLVVLTYLKTQVRPDKVNQYLIMFDFYQNGMRERETKTGEKQFSLYSVKAILISEKINEVLIKKQKLLALLQLLEILTVTEKAGDEEVDFIRTIAHSFKFQDYIFDLCYPFILGNLQNIQEKDRILIIGSEIGIFHPEIRFERKEYFKGQFIFLEIEQADLYIFRYEGEETQIFYNGNQLTPYKTYLFEKGTALKNVLLGNLLYGDILKLFFKSKRAPKVQLHVQDLRFSFSDSPDGIYPFNLSAESGQLIGIMGGSGVGKSTLLSLLGGILKPSKGKVLINGYNVHRSKEVVSGIIGYISQDDILFEELTVYQNLYYNAKLCFKSYSNEKIIQRVKKMLVDFDLLEIQDLKVGNALNKFISGGQRKRLNIAIELIREPFLLLVDEPTSGLSSNDSDKVVDLLKEQSLKGKLVIVNIHQPSSDVFKQFDKVLVMDKGGRVVFQGSPVDSAQYFKHHFHLIDADDSECPTCGNISPEHTLQILEVKKVNEGGDYINERQMSPELWYAKYIEEQDREFADQSLLKLDLPDNDFEIPGKLKQFRIFIERNVWSKISDKQYLLINLLEAPVLAFILAWFTKFNVGTENDPNAYLFSENINLPVYIFMSVIVALFIGLMLSAEEIINDRKILNRERFLNLSQWSYFNSKVVFVAGISAVQMLLFVLIGNSILQIRGMFFEYWLMLFLSALLANLLGLIISATLKSVVAIYILIPILLVPQILMGGAMIRFDKLNTQLSHPKYVPLIGDIMVSRWAYEGLAVMQYKKNQFQKHFFENDMLESNASYIVNSLIPELLEIADITKRNVQQNSNQQQSEDNIALICTELQKLSAELGHNVDWMIYSSAESISPSLFSHVSDYLNTVRNIYLQKLDESIEVKDNIISELAHGLGGNSSLVLKFKNEHYNNSLADLLLNKKQVQKIKRYKNEIIRLDEPVYLPPAMKFGRAHFYSPYKRIGDFYIDSYWFNIAVLSLMLFMWYLCLLLELLPKGLRLYNRLNIFHRITSIPQRIIHAFKPAIKRN